MFWIEDLNGRVALKVWLQPRASKDAVSGLHGDALKIFVTSAPVDGKANQRLIGVLAKQLDVSPSNITIRAGHSSRRKTLQISGLTVGEIKKRLGQ